MAHDAVRDELGANDLFRYATYHVAKLEVVATSPTASPVIVRRVVGTETQPQSFMATFQIRL